MTTQKRKRRKPWARKKPMGARELALQILTSTESRGAFSDRLLESRLHDADLSPEDSHLVTALVQGALRHRATLDHHLAYFARENWAGLPAWIRGVLRLGLFQILFLPVRRQASDELSVVVQEKAAHGDGHAKLESSRPLQTLFRAENPIGINLQFGPAEAVLRHGRKEERSQGRRS